MIQKLKFDAIYTWYCEAPFLLSLLGWRRNKSNTTNDLKDRFTEIYSKNLCKILMRFFYLSHRRKVTLYMHTQHSGRARVPVLV